MGHLIFLSILTLPNSHINIMHLEKLILPESRYSCHVTLDIENTFIGFMILKVFIMLLRFDCNIKTTTPNTK